MNIQSFFRSLLEGLLKLIVALTTSPGDQIVVAAAGQLDSKRVDPEKEGKGSRALPVPAEKTSDDVTKDSGRKRRAGFAAVFIIISLIAVLAVVLITKPWAYDSQPEVSVGGTQIIQDGLMPEATSSLPLPVETATIDPCASVVSEGSFVGDITIPDGTVIEPGETFTKTWRFVNTGPCAWPEGFVAKFVSGEAMGAVETKIVLPRVEPGATIDVSIELTVPEALGRYRGIWGIFDNQGNKVIVTKQNGDFWVDIQAFLAYITSTPAP